MRVLQDGRLQQQHGVLQVSLPGLLQPLFEGVRQVLVRIISVEVVTLSAERGRERRERTTKEERNMESGNVSFSLSHSNGNQLECPVQPYVGTARRGKSKN